MLNLRTTLRRLSRGWPEELRSDVARIGVRTAAELLELAPVDVIVRAMTGRGFYGPVIGELIDHDPNIDRALFRRFYSRRTPTRPLPAPNATPSSTWGCLWRLRGPAPIGSRGSREATSETIAAVRRGISALGLDVVPLVPSEADAIVSRSRASMSVDATSAGDDDILVRWDEKEWVAVSSRARALTPPEDNELARLLSVGTTVLGVVALARQSTSIAVWKDGRLSQRWPATADGDAIEELDLAWLASIVDDLVAPDLLRDHLGDAEAVARLVGFRERGFERAIENVKDAPRERSTRDGPFAVALERSHIELEQWVVARPRVSSTPM